MWELLGMCKETFGFLMFSAWGPLSPANGFPNPLTVIENTSKSIVKPSKISVSVRAHGYGSLAVRWGRPRERCEFQCEIIGNYWEMKVSVFALAPFPL